jgi:N-acetylglucosamine kinase-like BadF-type ATPase
MRPSKGFRSRSQGVGCSGAKRGGVIAVIGDRGFRGTSRGALSVQYILQLRALTRKREETRLLEAFMTLSDGDPRMPVSDEKAAELANIYDYAPVMDRLVRRGDIYGKMADTPSGYYYLSERGRNRLTEPRS